MSIQETRPSIIMVAGAIWGDEGKGKVIDYLAKRRRIHLGVRGVGGPNAGHSVVDDSNKVFSFHQGTSTLVYGIESLLGPGMVINVPLLMTEMDTLQKQGLDTGKLRISDGAALILDYNRTLDGIANNGRQDKPDAKGEAIGTTGQGIGPTYTDKAARRGFRVADLLHTDNFLARLDKLLGLKRAEAVYYGNKPGDEFTVDYYREKIKHWREFVEPMMVDAARLLETHFSSNHTVLVEGAQGVLLGVDCNPPYATSSDTSVMGQLAGAGIQASWIAGSHFQSIGVQKAFNTRVGGGPFPTELSEGEAALLRDSTEYGVTTGRARRIGEVDGVAAAFAQRRNHFTDIAITKIDHLFGRGERGIARAYLLDGQETADFPTCTDELYHCKPIYGEKRYELTEDITGVTSFDQLPTAMQGYVRDIMRYYPGARLSFIGTGRKTSQMISL